MNTHTPLGALIAHERTALGCTVKTFCKECGITMKTYYRLIEKKQLCVAMPRSSPTSMRPRKPVNVSTLLYASPSPSV